MTGYKSTPPNEYASTSVPIQYWSAPTATSVRWLQICPPLQSTTYTLRHMLSLQIDDSSSRPYMTKLTTTIPTDTCWAYTAADTDDISYFMGQLHYVNRVESTWKCQQLYICPLTLFRLPHPVLSKPVVSPLLLHRNCRHTLQRARVYTEKGC